jgi:Xaa-Pro dipeptidase
VSIKPGIPVSEVDRVAEQVITELDTENMLHRTGHSLGLEVHELPSVVLTITFGFEGGDGAYDEPGIYDFNWSI